MGINIILTQRLLQQSIIKINNQDPPSNFLKSLKFINYKMVSD
jgi:hypothetical protein